MHTKQNVTLGTGINYYRPPQQFIPPNVNNNKTFSGLLANKSPSNQPIDPNNSNQSVNFINPNKNNFGFGRYSWRPFHSIMIFLPYVLIFND